jgi:ribosomal protein S4
MFSRRLDAVVEMNPEYMARYDGSEQAAGRGSGTKLNKAGRGTSNNKQTPYMAMTFAPLERRLDTAIFRALFASSTREARMIVVHGGVKVNGKKVSEHLGNECSTEA